MKKPTASVCFVVLMVCAVASGAGAQKAKAPNGYYPQGFFGSIFTGRVESVNADTQELTLVYRKGKKTEQFVGRLESLCSLKGKNGTLQTFGVSEMQGMVLTAFYDSHSRKSGGQKVDENAIFAISFAERDGKPILDENRVIIFCSHETHLVFKVF